MTDQLLAELRKMRSTRTNLGLLAGMIALILLTVLLNGFVPKAGELMTHDNQHALLSAGTSAALFAALIGVMAITSEFRHGTIRPTFVVTPQRTRVVGAKVIASLLMGALFGLVAIGLSLGVGYGILAVRDIPLELGTGHVLWLVFGTPAMTSTICIVAEIRLGRHLTTGTLVRELTSPDFDVPTTATFAAGRLWAVNARFGTPPTPTTAYWITQVPLH